MLILCKLFLGAPRIPPLPCGQADKTSPTHTNKTHKTMILKLVDIAISLIMSCWTFARAQYRSLCHQRSRRRPNGDCYRRMSSTSSDVGTQTSTRQNVLPGIHRIILIRHGESLGNIDERAYATTADWRIPLTERGREQARLAGRLVATHLGCNSDAEINDRIHGDGLPPSSAGPSANAKGKIFFYFSPYLRTRQTLREILREVDPECIVGMREEPRM